MPVVEVPQCAAPFTIGPGGVETVEQGSLQNQQDNIYNIAVCPQGFRDDLPEFGIPSLVWQTLPLDLGALEESLHRYEPAADLTLEQHRTAIAEAAVTVAVGA
jgi:hypothetical protein